MRYFLITFALESPASIGTVTLFSNKFPSRTYINDYIKNIIGEQYEPTIINFYEFKSKEDYDNFDS